ncbi:hypothetical protein [Methylorubrum extorquens]|uniref:hypothetical protein n=1 Tax=Methylorubrum extorquens TaxID=408 RepID=UPI0022371EF1|nr:hypothetical protein [Methylorubrum extorquens]UYW29246.1 hypothetical protein OKC48_12305 [Methylorubrum extorquens]UYW31052.1 hypothetical protein OKB92_18895 [Methylorubrum extorquens]
MNRAMSCTVLALTLLAAPASAQRDHDHPAGPHGGRVEDAGPWHAELVTRAETVSVYLTDGDGKPLPAEGFKAVAILKSSAKAARILLSPEGNRLAGKAEAALGERPSGAVRITGPGGVTASARFD